MNKIITFSFLVLSVSGTCHWREGFAFREFEMQLQMEMLDLQMDMEIQIGMEFDMEIDDDLVPEEDPIWWFVRTPEDEFWVTGLTTNYPRIDMFGEEILNMLQFILIGAMEVVNSLLVDCPLPMRLELMWLQETIRQRRACNTIPK